VEPVLTSGDSGEATRADKQAVEILSFVAPRQFSV
jgi:hypothetical protein